MKITKIDGKKVSFAPNKMLTRIKKQSTGLSVSPDKLFQEVVPHIYDGITTTEIDELIAFKAADLIIKHPDYSVLGGRILMTRQSKIIGVEPTEVDMSYDFFAASTFLEKYSIKNNLEQPLELPSTMHKRVVDYLYDGSSKDSKKLQKELGLKKVNFATPTLANAGVDKRNNLISCQVVFLEDDSTEGISNTLNNISLGSRSGSGIGLCIDILRSSKTNVARFNGKAGGVVRFADMVQSHMRFFKQGSRAGSCALYLSTWHRDIFDFLSLTLPIGDEKMRMRDLFTAVTVDDVFMECLLSGETYYTFCPHEIKLAGLKALHEVHGDEFKDVYNQAVEKGLGHGINPQEIWDAIIKAQGESGKPYVFYKDNANRINMQDNIGVIRQSQLCIEIMTASKPRYTPQCTLASINLAEQDSISSIKESARILTRALNKVIDKNVWSDPWSEAAGLDQRNLAIGVAGLADFFAKRGIAFESEEAKKWNKEIFEAIYKASLTESHKLAVEEGRTYPAWEGSKYSRGETYIEGWSPLEKGAPIPVLNSLLIGLMPTASSAILLGAFECFQPVDANIFSRKVGDGEYLVINKHLVKDLLEIGMWNDEVVEKIIASKGSVQDVDGIPSSIKEVYKTVWEISQKSLLDLAIGRSPFIDQSQSMNVYHKDADYNKISSALMYAWKNGLKTGVYYTRTQSKQETNTKLASSGVKKPTKPENSLFSCAGGGCDA